MTKTVDKWTHERIFKNKETSGVSPFQESLENT